MVMISEVNIDMLQVYEKLLRGFMMIIPWSYILMKFYALKELHLKKGGKNYYSILAK